jgi:hypothetical protein
MQHPRSRRREPLDMTELQEHQASISSSFFNSAAGLGARSHFIEFTNAEVRPLYEALVLAIDLYKSPRYGARVIAAIVYAMISPEETKPPPSRDRIGDFRVAAHASHGHRKVVHSKNSARQPGSSPGYGNHSSLGNHHFRQPNRICKMHSKSI